MENHRLNSKIEVGNREFMVQTINDISQKSVISSLFVDGRILEVFRRSHAEEATDEEVSLLVKTTHEEKKAELEHLLSTYDEVIKSGNVDLMFHLGTAFYYKRMYDETRTLLTAVLKLNPGHHQASSCLGLTCMEQGNFEDAIKALSRAAELRPNYADYHNNYGEALLEAGFCRRAVEEFETALRLNIYYADAYFNLGIAYIFNAIKREDFEMYSNLAEKTTDLFNRAALISSDFKSSQFDEAREVLRQGDLPRALNLLKAIRQQKREAYRQEFSGYYLRFMLYSDWANEGAVISRIQSLKEEIEKNPNYVDIHYELALCYLKQAQIAWQKGIDQFKETLDINPRMAKADMGLERAEGFSTTIKTAISEIARSEREK